MIIKFTKKYLIYIMLFIPFLKPESLVVSDTATNIFSLWRVISALIVISVYIIKIIPNHPYSLSIIIILFKTLEINKIYFMCYINFNIKEIFNGK